MRKLKRRRVVEPEILMAHLQSNMQGEVGASPINIARAYMGNRPLELGINTYNIMSKDGKEQQNSDLILSKPHILTLSSTSSTCWPGANVTRPKWLSDPIESKNQIWAS